MGGGAFCRGLAGGTDGQFSGGRGEQAKKEIKYIIWGLRNSPVLWYNPFCESERDRSSYKGA